MAKMTIAALTLMLMVLVSPQAFADGKKTETTKIHANMHCEACEATITKNLAFEKGVKDIITDSKAQTVLVTFDPGKTTPEKLCAAISKLGYKAYVMDDTKKAGCATDCTGTSKNPAGCDQAKPAPLQPKSGCGSGCTGKSPDPAGCGKK